MSSDSGRSRAGSGAESGDRIGLRLFSYLLAVTIFFGSFSPSLEAEVLHTQAQAIALAFPGADRVEKKTHVLSDPDAAVIERRSRSSLGSRLVTLHTAHRGETLLGYAVIDVHTVRTQSEALMIALDARGRVLDVRVLVFREPLDYMPAKRWYALFLGKDAGDALRVGHDIDGVTGATLTTRATADAVRRMLAYYEVLLTE